MDKCPCGASLPRQKCIHDLGGDCARNEDKESSLIAQLTAEVERLKRVVEQAIDCGSLEVVTITDENKNDFLNGWRKVGTTIIAGTGDTEKFIAGYPEGNEDLFAQLKGADL